MEKDDFIIEIKKLRIEIYIEDNYIELYGNHICYTITNHKNDNCYSEIYNFIESIENDK